VSAESAEGATAEGAAAESETEAAAGGEETPVAEHPEGEAKGEEEPKV